jgi:hypothetical protein
MQREIDEQLRLASKEISLAINVLFTENNFDYLICENYKKSIVGWSDGKNTLVTDRLAAVGGRGLGTEPTHEV